ncbi:MAG: helix-turn-helix domain-containing protein [Cyanobacteria bacterium P01_H01_bin.162]
MSGIYHLEITESETELKTLLRTQKTASAKERIQLLYLLKSEQAHTIQQAAALLGRHRVTAQKWAKRYRQGGLAQLLSHQPRSGAKSTLPAWAEAALRNRLEQSEGFESYTAIQTWLAIELGIVAPYKTVHKWVYYRLGASPKGVRPKSDKQDEAALAASKKTP